MIDMDNTLVNRFADVKLQHAELSWKSSSVYASRPEFEKLSTFTYNLLLAKLDVLIFCHELNKP